MKRPLNGGLCFQWVDGSAVEACGALNKAGNLRLGLMLAEMPPRAGDALGATSQLADAPAEVLAS